MGEKGKDKKNTQGDPGRREEFPLKLKTGIIGSKVQAFTENTTQSEAAMAADGPTYAFEDSTPRQAHRRTRRAGRARSSAAAQQHISDNSSQHGQDASGDNDPTDGTGSLTYSASSSVNGSSAGESTDSSFADIMKVLDLDDSSELAAIMAKEGINPEHQLLLQHRTNSRRAQGHHRHGSASVTDSLNYSEDGESSISVGGAVMPPQTISGQPSDSHGPDGGGLGANEAITFQAATMPDAKGARTSKNGSKGKTPKARGGGSRADVPSSQRDKNGKSNKSSSSKSRSISADDRSSTGSAASTPTSPPPRAGRSKSSRNAKGEGSEGDKVWYAQWWMCGFLDAFGNPK